MAKYSYVAKSIQGEEKTGILDAKDEYQLARMLKEQGFMLISAKTGEPAVRGKISFSLPFFNSVSLVDKLMFVRNLQVMVSSGLPLPRALDSLSSQVKNKKFKKALLDIKDRVIKGENFSECLKLYPDIFSELFQNMVKVGEESGTLDQVFSVLARQLERDYELRSKIKGAMTYPAVILVAMFGIGFLMLILVVPKLTATFEELNVQLPLTTQLVINAGNFLAKQWYFAIAGIVVFIIAAIQVLKTRIVKRRMDFLFLRFPAVSVLVKKINTAYTARTLSSLIASGVSLVRSLEITAGVVNNVYFKEVLLQASEQVKKGKKLSEAFQNCQDVYPLTFCQMLQVGEETGETSGILSKLAEFFESEVSDATKNLTSIIEPILMLFIGAVVGFFAISMIQPMYSMLGGIQ